MLLLKRLHWHFAVRDASRDWKGHRAACGSCDSLAARGVSFKAAAGALFYNLITYPNRGCVL